MPTITRKIGLSLGADTCWPICFEDIVSDLAPRLRSGGNEIDFQVSRVAVEPFALRDKVDYDLVIDRLTYWYAPIREWIKKAVLMDGVYVWNNPWSIESNQKHTAYCAMMALGIPIPETWMVPPKNYDEKADLRVTLQRYARLFDLGKTAGQAGYPCFMKPYDGGGWVGVTKCDDEAALREAYEHSGKSLMHVQKGILPFERFVRCVGLGPQTVLMSYDPSAPLHQRYQVAKDFVTPAQRKLIEDITLTINAFFGWDFNSCEALLQKGTWWPIDFANPCPDSQVTSLHYHFPWLVKAKIRWALFVAGTKRPMRKTLDWEPYYAVRAKNLPYEETVAAYGALARAHFDTQRFEEFCARELGDLDQVAWDYFGSERAKTAVRKKVETLFPRHEWDAFTEHFFAAIQRWREDDLRARTGAREAKVAGGRAVSGSTEVTHAKGTASSTIAVAAKTLTTSSMPPTAGKDSSAHASAGRGASTHAPAGKAPSMHASAGKAPSMQASAGKAPSTYASTSKDSTPSSIAASPRDSHASTHASTHATRAATPATAPAVKSATTTAQKPAATTPPKPSAPTPNAGPEKSKLSTKGKR